MFRISRLTDYGTLVLAHLSNDKERMTSATEVADATGIALPTVSKLLKLLAKAGLVLSARGAQGGYRLARDACDISAADIIGALEGPVNITACSATDSRCDYESVCNVGGAWQRINLAFWRALADINLRDLQRANAPLPQFNFAGLPVSVVRKD